MHYLDKQKELAREVGDQRNFGMAWFGEGYILKQDKDYTNAVHAYYQSVEAFRENNDPELAARALNNIGTIFMETGDYEGAIGYCKGAREEYLKLNDAERMAMADYNLGVCQYSQKEPDYGLAEGYFQEALVYAVKLREKQGHYFNRVYNTIGAMCYQQGNYETAIENYSKSLEYLGESEKEGKAIAYMNIGEAYTATGQYAVAAEWLDKAFGLSGELQQHQLVGLHNIRAELYQKQGRHMEAVADLGKAIEMANKEVVNPRLQKSLSLLNASYQALRSQGRPVGEEKVLRAMGLYEQQSALGAQMKEEVGGKLLKASMSNTIGLAREKKEKASTQWRNGLLSVFLAVLVVLALAAFGWLWHYYRKYSQYFQKSQEYQQKYQDYFQKSQEYQQKSQDYEQKSQEYQQKYEEYQQKCQEHEQKSQEYQLKCQEHEQKSQGYQLKCQEHEQKSQEYQQKYQDYHQRSQEYQQKYEEYQQKCQEHEKKMQEYQQKYQEVHDWWKIAEEEIEVLRTRVGLVKNGEWRSYWKED